MQSPERLQARLEELAGGVEKERALVTDAERRSRDLQARMDTIAKVCCPSHQSDMVFGIVMALFCTC